MELNNILFSFSLLLFGFFFIKLSLVIAKKSKFNLLSDNQFNKPQAFHENETLRLGGITISFLLCIVFLYLYSFKNIFFPEYISFSALFFFLGLADDLKINIRPKFRLLLMILFLVLLVISNELYIEKTGLQILNNILEISFVSVFFICLCFLFIINGANLIDGFNGLLAIHSLIIFVVLFAINLSYENHNLSHYLFYICIPILLFLNFNFPKARIFLGDSGAYVIGTLISISVIKTSILIPAISPFFFCILLFYLFFEVFFSFFRKLIYVRQSPLLPDNKHMHMLLYKLLFKKNKSRPKSNYRISIYINLIYSLTIAPGIFFMHDGMFCKYYFLFLLIFYIYFYKILREKIKV